MRAASHTGDRTRSVKEKVKENKAQSGFKNAVSNVGSAVQNISLTVQNAAAGHPAPAPAQLSRSDDGPAYWQRTGETSRSSSRSSRYTLTNQRNDKRPQESRRADIWNTRAWEPEKILNTGRDGRIQPYKASKLRRLSLSKETKQSFLEDELRLLEKIKAETSSPEQRRKIVRQQNEAIHELNRLDAGPGKRPRKYIADGFISTTPEQPLSLIDGKEQYNRYVKESRTPNMEEFRRLQRAGADIDFTEYAKQKQRFTPKNYGQFSYDNFQGKLETQRFGNVTVVRNYNAAQFRSMNDYSQTAVASGVQSQVSGKDALETKPTYIIYDKTEFPDQAEYQKAQLEKEGISAVMIGFETLEEFEEAWNSGIVGDAAEVIMLSHTHEHGLIFEDGKTGMSIDGLDSEGNPGIGNIHDLEQKNIDTLTVLGCNAGHLSAAESEEGNLAQGLIGLGNIGEVIAYDGSVSFGGLKEKINEIREELTGEEQTGGDFDVRASIDQFSYMGIRKKYRKTGENDEKRVLPKGQIRYLPDGTYEVIGEW